MLIYISAYPSVTSHNTTCILHYVFNINSRKIDGHYRSWIKYLKERSKVCIFDRSIKWHNTYILLFSNGNFSVFFHFQGRKKYTFTLKTLYHNLTSSCMFHEDLN